MYPDRTAWLAAGGDAFSLGLYEGIGRVAPFAHGENRALATIHPDLPQTGCIGDWVGDVGVLRAAEDWLRDQGCTVAHGPKEMCAWFTYRASLGPEGPPPFTFEPTAPGQPWLDAGYAPIRRYVSILADHEAQIRAGTSAAASLAARGWRIQALPADDEGHVPEGFFHEALSVVHGLFSAGFADSNGFAEVPLDALRAWYGRYRTELDPRLTLFATDPSGLPVGVILAIPDRNQPERGWFQVMTLAVLPEHRSQGVGSWLVAACHKAARGAGFKAGVHALVHVQGEEDHTWFRGDVIRRYALLAREL